MGFVLAFDRRTASLTFYGRYLFRWVVPISVVVGVVVSSMTENGVRPTLPAGPTMGAAALLLAWAGYLTWIDLSTRSNADWQAVSAVITEDLPADTGILYDAVRPLGIYRKPFAGNPR